MNLDEFKLNYEPVQEENLIKSVRAWRRRKLDKSRRKNREVQRNTRR